MSKFSDMLARVRFDDSWTGPDKDKHLFLAFGMAMLASLVTDDPVMSFGIVAVLALLKEIVYDLLMQKGTPSFQDWVVSCLGASAAIVLFFKVMPFIMSLQTVVLG